MDMAENEIKKAEPEEEDYEELLLSLPKVKNWIGSTFCLYQGVWFEPKCLPFLLFFQKHFQAQDTDVVAATLLKSGTTWLKALTFTIMNRNVHAPLMTNSPLLSSHPHALVPCLELPTKNNLRNPSTRQYDDLPSPRTFSTHLPYKLLPPSMHDSKCRIVYLCRNPLDQFISHYTFFRQFTSFPDKEATPDKVEISEAFDAYFGGTQLMGPMWDHFLGYWEASLERPDKVLFTRFEDLKADTVGCAKKMAEFLGCPFSEEEEAGGVVGDVVKLCSFETLKGLEVNKAGESFPGVKHEWFFRKGEVGDWVNYLTPEMVKRAQQIVEEKLQGSGLTFEFGLN